MKFEDHILAPRVRYNPLAAWARIEPLYAIIVGMTGFSRGVLLAVRVMRREFRTLIKAAEIERRDKLKLDMLRNSEWRYRVIEDLGGVEALWRWWLKWSDVRSNPVKPTMRVKLTVAEQNRRAHIRMCAKATINPHIRRDPFKVDQEGQFRLPPLPRHMTEPQPRAYEYRYDARPVTKFTSFNTPIMVWPDEFLVFMEDGPLTSTSHTKHQASRRYAFLDKWLAAILAETAEPLPTQPLIKTKTARAPPCEILSLNFTPSVPTAGG